MKPADRRAGYWNRERETMSAGARERYQAGWLGALLEHAGQHAPGVRRRLEQAGLSPKNFRSTDDLARLPVIKKSAMPDLQKADPPFGGFCSVPLARIRKIFVSPGPIFEPMGPEVSGFHAETGLFAGGFRPGDIVINTFSYHLTPAAHEIDESLHLIGCPVGPTGVGQSAINVSVSKSIGATAYCRVASFLTLFVAQVQRLAYGQRQFQLQHA